MEQTLFQDFFNSSIENHNSYKKIGQVYDCSGKTGSNFYVVEINGVLKRQDLSEIFKYYDFSYKNMKWKTSVSKDGLFKKTNEKITKETELFITKSLVLQHDISLKGYSVIEENDQNELSKHEETYQNSIKNWEDDGFFTEEKVENCHFFGSKKVDILIFDTRCVLKFKETDYDYISSLVSWFIGFVFINYIFIMTKDATISKKTSFFMVYVTSKKNERSVLVPNYSYTLPCIRFSENGTVYLLDMYNNLKKIGYGDEPLIQGFMNVSTNEFTPLEGFSMHYDLGKKDALVYQTSSGFEIYTKPENIYIDEMRDKQCIRRTFFKNNFFNPLFLTENVMDEKQMKEIKKVVRYFNVKKMVKRVYKQLDVDYLLRLPENTKQSILKYSKMYPENWIASFFVKMLTISSDEKKPIIIKLDKPSGKLIEYKQIELEKQLEKEKIEIDKFHENNSEKLDFYLSVTKNLDRLKNYNKEIQKFVTNVNGSITNAWMKCWEMIHTFDLVPKKHSSDFTIFCNAEYPGAFILALNHYIKTETDNKNYKWYANSLWPGEKDKEKDKEIFKDSFGLYKKYGEANWLMNEKNGGSVTDPKMIKIIEDRLANKVDLYTSDIGIGSETDAELNESPLNLGQIICGLKTLKEGGTLVCKMFLFFKPFNMSLLQLLTNVFDEFYITKPLASRPANSEIYIVGKGYKKDQKVIDLFMNALKTKKWNETIVPLKEDFYFELVYALHCIYGRQIVFLKKNLDCVEELYAVKEEEHKKRRLDLRKFFNKYSDLEKKTDTEYWKEFEMRENMVEYWKKYIKSFSGHVVKQLLKEDDLI